MHFFAEIVSESGLSGISLFATFALWMRVEHRLTKLETKLFVLPCGKCKANDDD